MPQIMHNNECFEYEVIKKKKKNIGITVTPEGEVKVTAPLYVEEGYIHDIVYKKADWIISKLKLFRERSKVIRDKEYGDGENISYLGQEYRLKVIEVAVEQGRIKFLQDRFEAWVNPDWDENKRFSIIRSVLTEWYRHEAFKIFKERTRYYADILKLYPNDIKIKEQKSIWGSCSSRNNINYNWKLIMAPLPVLDYIVVHELCHLKHRDHSKNFWNLVGLITPDYKEKRQWLRENGGRLKV
jgi:predicted metal-dependent hydrolase